MVWFGLWFGLRGLREERAPKEDGRPEKESEEAKRLRQRQRELRQREGVGGYEGEEAEGQEVGFHGFALVWFIWVRLDLVQGWRKVGWVATRKNAHFLRTERKECLALLSL